MQLIAVYVVFLNILFKTTTVTSIAQIQKGIYHNIVIGVSVRINNNKLVDIVTNLQKTLDKSSKFLCEATLGYASFGNITLFVPSQWTSNDSNIEIKVAKSEKFSSSEVQISEEGSQLFVQQSNECGHRGKYIQLPIDKLNNQTTYLEKQLAVMWSQLRYGVFPEYSRGVYFDPQFNLEQPHSCTDLPLNWKYKNSSCKAIEECEVVIDPLANSHLSSSLLFDTRNQQIKYFCNGSTHNPFARTPHNRICNGKSTWDVIKDNYDFYDRPITEQICDQLSPVTIELVQQKCQRLFVGIAINKSADIDRVVNTIDSSLVLLVSTKTAITSILTVINNDRIIFNDSFEAKNAMNLSEELSKNNLNSSFELSFIFDTLQKEIKSSGSQCEQLFVLIIDVESVPRPPTPEPPTTSTIDGGSGLGELTTMLSTEHSFITTKTIRKRDIEDFGNDDDLSSEFILVREKRAGGDEEVVKFLEDYNVKVYGIVVGSTTDATIEELAVFTGGEVFTWTSVEIDDVSDVLLPLIKTSETEDEKRIVKNQESKIITNSSMHHAMEFNFDEKSDVTFLIYHRTATKLKNLHFYKSLTRNYAFFNESNCVEFPHQSSTSCTFKEVSKGNWHLSVEFPSPSQLSSHLIAKQNVGIDIVEIKDSYTEPSLKVDFHFVEKLHFFVRLQYGPYIIENAQVTAVLTSDSTSEAITIDLKDDELNSDGTKTGVYSGFINSCIVSARYYIKYNAKTSNTTYYRKRGVPEPLTDFQKFSQGSVRMICGPNGQLLGKDITDLELYIRKDSFSGRLSWSEDWNKDTLSTYKIHFWNDLIYDRDIESWELQSSEIMNLKPVNGPNRREIKIDLRNFDGGLTFAIIATGKVKKDKKISNLVHTIKKSITTTTTTTTESSTSTSTKTPDLEKTAELSDYPYIIVGFVLLGVFTVGGVVLLFVLYKVQLNRRRRIGVLLDAEFESNI